MKKREEVRATAKTGAQKGRKLACHGLIPPEALTAVAEVYGYGASKYAARNWESGYPYTWSYDALQRHLNAFWSGEEIDPESGLSHLAHASFHIFSLITFQARGIGEDDRGCQRNIKKQGIATTQDLASQPQSELPPTLSAVSAETAEPGSLFMNASRLRDMALMARRESGLSGKLLGQSALTRSADQGLSSECRRGYCTAENCPDCGR